MTVTVVSRRSLETDAFLARLEEVNIQYEGRAARPADANQLRREHDPEYVARVLDGWCEEWTGRRPDFGLAAAEQAGCSLEAAKLLWREKRRRIFCPDGGRVHAGYLTSDRLCVFNDVALGAGFLARREVRTAIVSLDGLYSPGLEASVAVQPLVMSVSIHDDQPDADHDAPQLGIHNLCMAEDSGDDQLLMAVDHAIELCSRFMPDALLLVVGAAGHEDDEHTTLRYTLGGYYEATIRFARFADEICAGRMIGFGGQSSPANLWPSSIWAAATHAMGVPYMTQGPKQIASLDEPTPEYSGLRLVE